MPRRTAILILDLPDDGTDPRPLVEELAQEIRYSRRPGGLRVEHVEGVVVDAPAGDVARALRGRSGT